MTLDAKKEGNSEHFISNPLAFVPDPYSFNQELLKGRVAQFKDAVGRDRSILFYDRGIPDVLAYMNYFKQEYGDEFIKACMDYRYDEVLLLPPWKDIYISDNERLENFQEALEINGHLEEVYKSFGYHPYIIAEGTVDARISHILKVLRPE